MFHASYPQVLLVNNIANCLLVWHIRTAQGGCVAEHVVVSELVHAFAEHGGL